MKNEKELHTILGELASAPVELLSAADREKLGKQASTWVLKMATLQSRARLLDLEAEIPVYESGYFRYLQKSRNLKAPGKSAGPEELDRYMNELRALWKDSARERVGLQKLLVRLRSLPEEEGPGILQDLSPEELKKLGEYAALTEKTDRGVKSSRPGKSKASRLQWIRNLKQSGLSRYLEP